MKKSTILSIGLLIAFFLPWVDLTFFTLSGYDIPTSLQKLSQLNKVFSDNGNSDIYKFSYFIYLIPVFCVFNILKDFGIIKNISYFLNDFLVGIISSILILLYVINFNEKATSIFSIGYYLTVIFSVLGRLLYIFGDDSVKEKGDKTEVLQLDKTDLLNQLSQLHSLKEKNVITDEIYESERQKVLIKFQETNATGKINDTEPIEQSVTSSEEYDPEYEAIFNKRSWFQKNKHGIIGSIIAIVILIGVWIVNTSDEIKTTTPDVSNSNIDSSNNTSYSSAKMNGCYITNANNSNYVYFYKKADINTRKQAYFNSDDTVYVQKIENNFGYVEYANDRGQTSKGWVKMEDMHPCIDKNGQ